MHAVLCPAASYVALILLINGFGTGGSLIPRVYYDALYCTYNPLIVVGTCTTKVAFLIITIAL